MDPKLNLNNDLSDIICDKDLLLENEISKVKLEEADKENTFLRDEVKDLTVLLNTKIQTSSHNFKTYKKECLLQENFDTKVQLQFNFQTNSAKVICYTIKITFQIKAILSFCKLTVI